MRAMSCLCLVTLNMDIIPRQVVMAWFVETHAMVTMWAGETSSLGKLLHVKSKSISLVNHEASAGCIVWSHSVSIINKGILTQSTANSVLLVHQTGVGGGPVGRPPQQCTEISRTWSESHQARSEVKNWKLLLTTVEFWVHMVDQTKYWNGGVLMGLKSKSFLSKTMHFWPRLWANRSRRFFPLKTTLINILSPLSCPLYGK